MGRIKGITITLLDTIEDGKDDFGHPFYRETEIQVENVLVAPSSTDDVTTQVNLTGKKAEYTLAIPKGDQHDWKEKTVIFFGRKWRTIGIPLEGIEAMIPLDWNKKVMVETYE